MLAIGRIMAYGALVFGLLGCGRGFDWEGTWVGERDLPIQPGADQDVGRVLRRVKLALKSNGEFELIERGIPSSGLWSATGRDATLAVHSIVGQKTEERKLSVAGNEDGSITLNIADDLPNPAVTLSREQVQAGT